ncbi:unnamed protein product [Didymodactylos carnosus]|uniref:AIG1-type G domain-containing protein n=1 Tax=Didymodactylos carnosus TaxID=1234261 RepID=A0A814ZWU7_9BILA|nr:unnamed protein product [Didymodactylos carnosus]CAF1247885.1 unnamed protein product [Didymodactylos carnosus]CAF4010865.1 unnamed protein product [Didymodactylos carnosus]CAF4015009.1 unnamed protein product [Didymodactylos carnosus]
MAELKTQTIMIIGKTGSGKSRLINLLLKAKSAECYRSTNSITKTCKLYKFVDNGIIYELIDTMGLADTEEPPDTVVDKIKNFLKLNVNEIHWIIVTLNGNEKLTNENTEVLNNILEFLQLETYINHVVFCVAHADGWNGPTRDKFNETLSNNSTFNRFTSNGAAKILYSGAPDPDELEGDDDKEHAKKKEIAVRTNLLQALPLNSNTIVQDQIKQWRDEDIKKIIDTEFIKKKRRCTIL